MMNISQTRAFTGLRMLATPASALVGNENTIGIQSTNTLIAGIDTGYAAQALIVGSGSSFVLAMATNNKTGSTSWTAGNAQVETATAAGTVTTSAQIRATVTSAGMGGSPLNVNLSVVSGDTPTVWAEKVRVALAADPVISARFTVGGTGTSISLTRKPTGSYLVGSETVLTYADNDSTLNIALSNATGTATGITAAPTSTNTTAGVATAGVYAPDADEKDFEGNTLTAIATGKVGGFLIKNESGSTIEIDTSSTMTNVALPEKASIQFIAPDANAALQTFTITSASASLVSIVACGKTA